MAVVVGIVHDSGGRSAQSKKNQIVYTASATVRESVGSGTNEYPSAAGIESDSPFIVLRHEQVCTFSLHSTISIIERTRHQRNVGSDLHLKCKKE